MLLFRPGKKNYKQHRDADRILYMLLLATNSVETMQQTYGNICLFLSANNNVETTQDQGNTSEVSSVILHAIQKCMAWQR